MTFYFGDLVFYDYEASILRIFALNIMLILLFIHPLEGFNNATVYMTKMLKKFKTQAGPRRQLFLRKYSSDIMFPRIRLDLAGLSPMLQALIIFYCLQPANRYYYS